MVEKEERRTCNHKVSEREFDSQASDDNRSVGSIPTSARLKFDSLRKLRGSGRFKLKIEGASSFEQKNEV